MEKKSEANNIKQNAAAATGLVADAAFFILRLLVCLALPRVCLAPEHSRRVF